MFACQEIRLVASDLLFKPSILSRQIAKLGHKMDLRRLLILTDTVRRVLGIENAVGLTACFVNNAFKQRSRRDTSSAFMPAVSNGLDRQPVAMS